MAWRLGRSVCSSEPRSLLAAYLKLLMSIASQCPLSLRKHCDSKTCCAAASCSQMSIMAFAGTLAWSSAWASGRRETSWWRCMVISSR